LTLDEATERPAGSARDEPNQFPVLEPPKSVFFLPFFSSLLSLIFYFLLLLLVVSLRRPETSFMWFTSPWKTLKYIIWKHYKWYIISFLIILILVAAIVIFVYTAPQSLMNEIVGKLTPKSS